MCSLKTSQESRRGIVQEESGEERDVGNEYDQRLLWACVKMYKQSHDSV